MRDGLKPYDLVATWLQVRVLPLQRRVHRIWDMATWRDPTRICTRKLNFKELRARVKALTSSKMPDPFKFGLKCLHRGVKSPEVCSDCLLLFIRLLFTFIRLLFSLYFMFLFQHFIQSDVMEDGQVAGFFALDRT